MFYVGCHRPTITLLLYPDLGQAVDDTLAELRGCQNLVGRMQIKKLPEFYIPSYRGCQNLVKWIALKRKFLCGNVTNDLTKLQLERAVSNIITLSEIKHLFQVNF